MKSYEELCHCLQQVLLKIKRDGIKPFVSSIPLPQTLTAMTTVLSIFQLYSPNSSRLGKIVLELLRDPSSDIPEMLSGKQPLEILVEIGVEKLKRDFVHAFMGEIDL